MSPLQYQKQLRLQEARRLLLGESIDAADAAWRVGYESKFEEDILQLPLPRVRGSRRVAIRIRPPLEMKTEKSQRIGADELTEILQAAVQEQVNALAAGAQK